MLLFASFRFVSCSKKVNDVDKKILIELLRYGNEEKNDWSSDFKIIVTPRFGTISPWSSKTEDIISNVGLKNILRVEKLFGFKINCNINEGNIDLSMFFDRMTQSIYTEEKDFQNLFILVIKKFRV